MLGAELRERAAAAAVVAAAATAAAAGLNVDTPLRVSTASSKGGFAALGGGG